MTRIEETGNDLPTVLCAVNETGIIASITRTGERQIDHSELVHWERFDLTDPVTAKWGIERPFRNWSNGDLLYELRDDNWLLRISRHPLLGPWIGIDGGFAIFTSEDEALHYLQHHAATDQNQRDFIGDLAGLQNGMPPHNLRPYPILDLATRAEDLQTHNPFASICINPDDHRENMGYVSENSLITVAGMWSILSRNRFEKTSSYRGHQGSDTIGWSGGQEVQLMPLAKSFVDTSETMITRMEAEEEIKDFIKHYDPNDDSVSVGPQENRDLDSQSNDLDHYYLACWDPVTGQTDESPNIQEDFKHMLGWLSDYEKTVDRQYRVSGATSCNGGITGFSGSLDEGLEKTVGTHFQTGLIQLGVEILTRGYVPADSINLVSLCNSNLRTLHVEFAGYGKDLLWAVNDQELHRVLTSLSLPETSYNDWVDSPEVNIDIRGEAIGIQRIGQVSWELLSPNSQHFLSTALATLEDLGHIPQRDYAPISLEVVKSLEFELKAIFEAFKDCSASDNLNFDISKYEETQLNSYINGGRPPALGAMAYLLQPSVEADSDLRIVLYRFLMSLSNADFITSNQFTKRVLQRVLNKYRNGGAHEHPIKYEVCMEAVDELIGTGELQGIIPEVVNWKLPN